MGSRIPLFLRKLLLIELFLQPFSPDIQYWYSPGCYLEYQSTLMVKGQAVTKGTGIFPENDVDALLKPGGIRTRKAVSGGIDESLSLLPFNYYLFFAERV